MPIPSDKLSLLHDEGFDTLYIVTGKQLVASELDSSNQEQQSTENTDLSKGYGNMDADANSRTQRPGSIVELSADEQRWLHWYRQIKPEDRELVEPVVRGFADRGKGQQI